MTISTAVAVPQNASLSLLMDPVRFDHLQRVGKMLALSPLFPEHLRKGGNDVAIANGALVLNMANRLNEDPLTVAQNIYFVGGRPGWNTTYMIGKANQHGVFQDPIDWDIAGKGDTLSVTAFGLLARTGKRVQVTCDMEMAKKEGWVKNAKYQSIPEQMLRYRSAAFLIRLYCPEVMIGIPLQIEQVMQMRDITPDDDALVVSAMDESPIDVEKVADQKPKPQPQDGKVARAAQANREAIAEQTKREDAAKQTKDERQTALDMAETKKDTAKADDASTYDAETGEVDGESHPDNEQFRGLLAMMLADLDDSGPDDTEDTYGPQIEQMRKATPDLWREFQDALTRARTPG